MPFARRPDARIWWDQSGTGDPILLIVGHAYGADMWHRTAPELAASYRVIRFDYRGAGRSSDPPGPYSVQLMAEDALAILDAASAASAHVYGVSLGGAIALQLALDHPARVRSLILGCTAASAEGASRGALVTRVRSLLPAAALNRMAWKLLYGPGTPADRRAEDQQIVRRTRSSRRGRRGQLTGAASFDVTGRLEEIRIPALVMHGARDRIVPAASAQRLADGIAGARLVMFPDAGHAYITDVARAANQEVLHFLAGISGPAGSQHRGDVTLTRAGFVERAERLAALFAGGRAGHGVQAHRVSTRPLARGERPPPRRPGPRRSDLHQRQTRRTTRRGNPAGSRINDPDPQVLAIAPTWMADEEAPANRFTNDSEMERRCSGS